MNRTIVLLLGGVFALLLVGLFFTAVGAPAFYTPQVNSPEASTGQITGNQGILLALLILGVPGIIVGMGVSMYFVFWFLNREVTIVQQQPEQPFELLPAGTTIKTAQFGIANNAFFIILGLGLVMTIVTLLALVLTR